MLQTNLTNHFLIAMPALNDPNFYHSVTYICVHNEDGAMGIVINRTLPITLGEVFEQMDLSCEDETLRQHQVLDGGPVQQERGFILHTNSDHHWDSTLKVNDVLSVTSSKDILNEIAAGTGPDESLIALGYAGWGKGQLERELAENTWLNGEADKQIIFQTPIEKRWQMSAELLGVDLNLISSQTGHS